jgi:hypothetical protein
VTNPTYPSCLHKPNCIFFPYYNINDIDTNISDDTGIKLFLLILITGKDIQDLTYNVDTVNNSMLSWFDKNRLIINKGKSLALDFHHKSDKHIVFSDIILKDSQIMYASETKFLGVWLDLNLNWNFLVENLIIKLSKLCFALKTVK